MSIAMDLRNVLRRAEAALEGSAAGPVLGEAAAGLEALLDLGQDAEQHALNLLESVFGGKAAHAPAAPDPAPGPAATPEPASTPPESSPASSAPGDGPVKVTTAAIPAADPRDEELAALRAQVAAQQDTPYSAS